MRIRDMLKRDIETCAQINHLDVVKNFVMRNGRTFRKVKALPERMERHMCFMNSLHHCLANEKNGYKYVEGYVIRDGMPILIQHAWCYEPSTRRIIETTLERPEECQYFGVVFDPQEVVDICLKKKTYGVLEHHGRGLEWLKGRDPEVQRDIERYMEMYRHAK